MNDTDMWVNQPGTPLADFRAVKKRIESIRPWLQQPVYFVLKITKAEATRMGLKNNDTIGDRVIEIIE